MQILIQIHIKTIGKSQGGLGFRQIGPLADFAANWAAHFLVLWQIGPPDAANWAPTDWAPTDWAPSNWAPR